VTHKKLHYVGDQIEYKAGWDRSNLILLHIQNLYLEYLDNFECETRGKAISDRVLEQIRESVWQQTGIPIWDQIGLVCADESIRWESE